MVPTRVKGMKITMRIKSTRKTASAGIAEVDPLYHAKEFTIMNTAIKLTGKRVAEVMKFNAQCLPPKNL